MCFIAEKINFVGIVAHDTCTCISYSDKKNGRNLFCAHILSIHICKTLTYAIHCPTVSICTGYQKALQILAADRTFLARGLKTLIK